ncbi:hypothetical protein MHY1_00272 [Methylovirgula sp. HY1]|nr:hypothetical protein MHY1_00272 [Methylovirgula sp. HY1]
MLALPQIGDIEATEKSDPDAADVQRNIISTPSSSAAPRIRIMIDKAASAHAIVPDEDARALLARLYREIGISAVAAALEVMAFAPSGDQPPASPSSATGERPQKKGLAA